MSGRNPRAGGASSTEVRPARLGLLALLAIVLTTIVVALPWIDAQRRAAIVLSTTSPKPVLSWLVRVATGEPHSEEATIAGVDTTIVSRDGKRPAVVLIPGVVDGGRENPDVQRLAPGLARAVFRVFVPDLTGPSGTARSSPRPSRERSTWRPRCCGETTCAAAARDQDPLRVVRGLASAGLDPDAAAVVRLLANRSPARFDGLYAVLPGYLHSDLQQLSPQWGRPAPEPGRARDGAARRDRAAERVARARASVGEVRVAELGSVAHGLPKTSIGNGFATQSWLARTIREAR
jgi:pimeloyl-ACP methyl ester carboxylesterase